MPREYLQGKYTPRYPEKYVGDVKNIIYRSSWELNLMSRLDLSPSVTMWNSEGLAIPYTSPVDGRVHRYFPDFLIRIKHGSNEVTILIEVKPHSQTELRVPKRKTRKFINEVTTYAINTAKWNAAKEFCKDQGWEFRVVTEKEYNFL